MLKFGALAAVVVVLSNLLPANITTSKSLDIAHGKNGHYTLNHGEITYDGEMSCTVTDQTGIRLSTMCEHVPTGDMLRIRLHKTGSFTRIIGATPVPKKSRQIKQIIPLRGESFVQVRMTDGDVVLIRRENVRAKDLKNNLWLTTNNEIRNFK